MAQAGLGSGFWSVLPSILWMFLILGTVAVFRKELQALLRNLAWRLRTGAALKFFSVELGQSYVSPAIEERQDETALEFRTDANEERWRQREQYYKPNRNIHLVHRLAPSNEPKMLYDIQLYLLPHRDATLANVSKVEYYFGRHWGSQIFTSIDRARGFPITTSAYGSFVCTAKIYFTDGEKAMVHRYVDFEMGSIGSKH
jgi:hypothetical protein